MRQLQMYLPLLIALGVLLAGCPSTEPTAAFTADTTEGEAPLTVQFTDQSDPGTAGITAWNWNFGDGDTSTEQHPEHTYTAEGSFDVSLQVASSAGQSTESKPDYITVQISYEKELALLDQAYEYYEDLRVTEDMPTALDETAAWLRTNALVSDAGVSTTGAELWIHYEMDLTAAIFANPFAGTVSKHSTPELLDVPYGYTVKHSNMLLPPSIFAPFRTSLTPGDETEELSELYIEPVTLVLPEVYIEEMALIDEIKWALGWTGPTLNAQHFIMKTHGGKVRLKGRTDESTALCSGEWVSNREQCLPHDDGFRAGRLMLVRVKGAPHKYIAFTPAFVRYWGGVPDPAHKHWLVRYVYIAACYGGCYDMQDAFLDAGAVCYAGFDGPVRNGFTQSVASEFFGYLLDSDTVSDAYDAVSPKVDSQTNAMFVMDSTAAPLRFFYRATLDVGGTPMETIAHDWLGLVGNEMGTCCVDAVSGQYTGCVIVRLDSVAEDTFQVAPGSDTSIEFMTTEGKWFLANAEKLDQQAPCEGKVQITSLGTRTGDPVLGSFEGTLAWRSTYLDPWETLTIQGEFTAIRRILP
ncbi:MAG: PKD domain-containing protein [Candidatus Hydrogenedentes bacterium]|nr:PKD domain-containing protein [Candidatus Hydrogenedentota bacterium]